MEKNVAICKGDGIGIVPMTSYIRLCRAIFGGDFKSTEQVIDNLENVVPRLLESLTELEKNVLIERFGLNGDEATPLEDAGKKMGFSEARIRQIQTKALRKLRHPVRSSYIRYGRTEINYSIGYCYKDYTDKLRNLLLEEIKCVVEHGDIKTVFLESVLRKNKISLKKILFDDEELIELDKLELTPKSFNCLRRYGIKNLKQLREMTDDDLMRVQNLVRKGYDEIKEKLEEYEPGSDGIVTLELEKDNEKTIYKFLCEDIEKIAKVIFSKIFCDSKKGKNIFNSVYSPGLKELLLLKGYAYVIDVNEDAELLIRQLQSGDFEGFAKEIIEVKKSQSAEKDESESVYVVLLGEEEKFDFIRNNQDKPILELLELANESENPEIIEDIKVIASVLGVCSTY